MHTLTIELGDRSYPIIIGTNLIADPESFTPYVTGKVMVVTNETLAPLYLDKILSGLKSFDTASVVLPDGEAHKQLDTLDAIFAALLENRFDRGCTLIALGGGVIGDMTGFAAASYQRGVNFIQVPTTLLAQVDSSVGGKTGVNHALGKNMIGAFHQPMAVLADMDTLDTLSDREFKAGMAEVIKHGFILDAAFFDWLETNTQNLLARDKTAIAHAVKRSCEIKAKIVAADEQERGVRALLNFGHTFGHAIEAAMGYGNWLHGEAISAGMVMALDLSHRLGKISDEQRKRGVALLAATGLPVQPPSDIEAATFLDFMQRDKKVLDGQMRLILLERIGQAFVTDEASNDQLMNTLQAHYDPA